MKKIGTVVLLLALFIGGAIFFPVSKPHVQLPAEKIAEISGIPITNTMTASWATIIVLSLLFLFATRNMRIVPGRLQCFAEAVVELLLSLCESVAGKEKGRKFFPLVATFFLFIVISNWMGLLPGYGTIGVWHAESTTASVTSVVQIQQNDDRDAVGHSSEAVKKAESSGEHEASEAVLLPLLRSANTDLNTTLALALISVVATQIFGIRSVGFFSYAGRFINVKGPIDFFVGALEAVSEVAKIVSFSFRLFGNIFAGEVLLGVMAFLIPWVASVPFMGLELFVGLIQAFIFMMLTLVFLTVATAEHGAEHSKSH